MCTDSALLHFRHLHQAERAFLGIIPLFSVWSQSAHGEASHEKVTGGNTCTRNHQGLQKKVLFALIQGSGCACFDVEQFRDEFCSAAPRACDRRGVSVLHACCTPVRAREPCPQQGTGRDGCAVGTHASGRAHVERALRWVSRGPWGAGAPGSGWRGGWRATRCGTARRGTARRGTAGLRVFLHTPPCQHQRAAPLPAKPAADVQGRASQRPANFPCWEGDSSLCQSQDEASPKIGLASNTEIMGRC